MQGAPLGACEVVWRGVLTEAGVQQLGWGDGPTGPSFGAELRELADRFSLG